jgi:hypothetical protein
MHDLYILYSANKFGQSDPQYIDIGNVIFISTWISTAYTFIMIFFEESSYSWLLFNSERALYEIVVLEFQKKQQHVYR